MDVEVFFDTILNVVRCKLLPLCARKYDIYVRKL